MQRDAMGQILKSSLKA